MRSGWRLGSVGPLLAVGHVHWRLLWKAGFPLRASLSLSLFGGAVSSLRPSGWGSGAWLWCVGLEMPARGRIGPAALGVCSLMHLASRAFPVPVFIYKSHLSPSHLATFLNCKKHITEFAILICLPVQETQVQPLGGEDPLEKGKAVFLPGDSQGQRSLAGYSPWGRKKSWTRLNVNTKSFLKN